ncbi:MAG: hypothetical protein H6661_07375 [Ardenticatenaceae bacterium]|nr:hypothetical protein [Ardenticatenaceae bacterium]
MKGKILRQGDTLYQVITTSRSGEQVFLVAVRRREEAIVFSGSGEAPAEDYVRTGCAGLVDTAGVDWEKEVITGEINVFELASQESYWN